MAYLRRTHDLAPVAVSRPEPSFGSPHLARAVLAAAVTLAIALAQLLGHGEAAVHAAAADPELTWLLRGMAVLKSALALGAVGLVAWRLGYPASRGLAAGLIAAAALMAAGPVLIWHIAPVGAAAVLFHAGMALLLVLCWADRSDTLTSLIPSGRGRAETGTGDRRQGG